MCLFFNFIYEEVGKSEGKFCPYFRIEFRGPQKWAKKICVFALFNRDLNNDAIVVYLLLRVLHISFFVTECAICFIESSI